MCFSTLCLATVVPQFKLLIIGQCRPETDYFLSFCNYSFLKTLVNSEIDELATSTSIESINEIIM
jgi:hypothetical protein